MIFVWILIFFEQKKIPVATRPLQLRGCTCCYLVIISSCKVPVLPTGSRSWGFEHYKTVRVPVTRVSIFSLKNAYYLALKSQ